MKRNFIYLFSVIVSILFCPACSDNNAAAEYDVFLLLGQSNMAGRGKLLPQDTAVMEGVWLLNPDGVPEPASNPINKYSTIRKDIGMQRMGPGYSFARDIHSATGRPVLLVANARGGSSINEWMPGEEYYTEALSRAREAMKYGPVKAIIWHQGESNSSWPEAYREKLITMAEGLRTELGCGEIPFVAGEIAPWHNNVAGFNAMISSIGQWLPNSACVSSAGTTAHIDDNGNHFDRQSQLLLGSRYAAIVLEMVYGL